MLVLGIQKCSVQILLEMERIIDGVNIHEANLDALEAIQYLTKNAQRVQDQVLGAILHSNKDTEYLTSFFQQRGEAHTNKEDMQRSEGNEQMSKLSKEWFKKMVPVVDYEDLEPYIRRLVNNNEDNVLSAQPIIEFFTSSGTSSGERKLLPVTADDMNRKLFYKDLVLSVLNKYKPASPNDKIFDYMFIREETKTPSGIVARPLLTSYYNNTHFADKIASGAYTSPIEAVLCPDLSQSMYCQLLCGLILKDQVVGTGAIYAPSFLSAIRFLEENWTSLCDDIQKGQLSPEITHEPLRAAVMKLLSVPNPTLAESIRMECSKDSWQGIVSRIWKRASYIETVVTGTMSQYLPKLDYYSGGLPIVSTMYVSSECCFGINLNPFVKPSEISYTLLPNMGYFEFIPMERSKDHDDGKTGNGNEILDLARVKVGKEYEVVVTTYSGLYRYKVGDVLKVSDFYNEAPQFQFVRRKKVILSVDAEKTDEACLHQAIQNARKLLESEHGQWNLVDYTACPDTSSSPGHYVIFWEVNGVKPIPTSLLEDCCLAIEESLDSVYRLCRNTKLSIGPLEIRVVQSGMFDALMHYHVSSGTSVTQYKTPRSITFSEALSIFNDKVLQKSFSPRCPSWMVEWSS